MSFKIAFVLHKVFKRVKSADSEYIQGNAKYLLLHCEPQQERRIWRGNLILLGREILEQQKNKYFLAE